MKKIKKSKILSVITAFILIFMTALSALLFISCGSSEKTIGVCMPKQDVDRWTEDGQNLKKQLEAKNYKVILDYAEDNSDKQIEQIEKMIDEKCDALIIAAKDCYTLNDVLEKASKKNIKIIAYDRLIMDTDYVDYYCTFDNVEVGRVQGEYIEEKFKLSEAGDPVTMEIFSGAADDSTSVENYNGQMDVLQKYIDSGRIIIKSGQTSFESTAIPDWKTENAEARMKELLKNYGDTKLDIVLSTNDSMAKGVINALKDAGYVSGDKPFPVLTGMDGDIENIISIINGEQSMTLFIDPRALANRTVQLVDELLNGKKPENIYDERNNNNKIIPTSVCKGIYIDKDNYMDLVRDNYYSEEDFK